MSDSRIVRRDLSIRVSCGCSWLTREPALPNHFGDEQQIGSDLFLAQNVHIGRYFNFVQQTQQQKNA